MIFVKHIFNTQTVAQIVMKFGSYNHIFKHIYIACCLLQWSIELLGHISSCYAKHHGVAQSSSLNELLQLWMTCPPTKSLIEIASECFASM